MIMFLVKITAIYFTNFNLFGDEAQYWIWSKNIALGYFSKPPFLSWFISFFTSIFGDSFFVLKLIPSIIYVFTACCVYDLCKGIGLDKKDALSGSLLFLFIPAVSFSSFVLSTDLFLLLFWTLSLNELVKIKNKPSLDRFILLGVFLGLAFLSKYAAIYFIICFFVYVFIDSGFRNFVYKNYRGFCLSFFCIILILLPNIFWNLNNGWVTLQHTSDNANLINIKLDIIRGLFFVGSQILMIGPFLFLSILFDYKNFKIEYNEKLLLVFSIPIFFIVFIEAIIVRANANWAAPALIAFFIFLYIKIIKTNGFFKMLNLSFNFIFCVIFFVIVGISFPSNVFKRIDGINTYAKNIHSLGLEKNIVNFVVTDRLLYASMKYELREKELLFHMPHRKGDKITNHFKITSPLKKDMDESFILIGSPTDIDYLEGKYYIKKKKSPKQDFLKRDMAVYEVVFD